MHNFLWPFCTFKTGTRAHSHERKWVGPMDHRQGLLPQTSTSHINWPTSQQTLCSPCQTLRLDTMSSELSSVSLGSLWGNLIGASHDNHTIPSFVFATHPHLSQITPIHCPTEKAFSIVWPSQVVPLYIWSQPQAISPLVSVVVHAWFLWRSTNHISSESPAEDIIEIVSSPSDVGMIQPRKK